MYISHFVVSLYSLADDPYMKYVAVYLCMCAVHNAIHISTKHSVTT